MMRHANHHYRHFSDIRTVEEGDTIFFDDFHAPVDFRCGRIVLIPAVLDADLVKIHCHVQVFAGCMGYGEYPAYEFMMRYPLNKYGMEFEPYFKVPEDFHIAVRSPLPRSLKVSIYLDGHML